LSSIGDGNDRWFALLAGEFDLAAGKDDSVFDFKYGFAGIAFDVHLTA
jgi:hypothetical protein